MDAMQRTDDAGRAAPLVLELASGTARLHGEELELPLREFRLLAALAARVREPIPSEDLIKAIWPDAPWTSTTELYTLVSRLRRQIDGADKFGNHIRNRRGFGYVLDLQPDQLIVIDPAPIQPTPLTIDLTEKSSNEPVQDSVDVPAAGDEKGPPQAQESRRRFRAVPAVAMALVLIAASWGTGYVLSKRNAADRASAPVAQDPEPNPPKLDGSNNPPGRQRDNGKSKGDVSNRRQSNESSAITGPTTAQNPDDPAPDTSGSMQGSGKGSRQEQAPALPPAPTRYLYHLVNPETGDHFVTTDSATASEQEARGYEGGAIGRIYTSREENTKAITTNHGTAYIFIGSAPKTEPASRTVALWYSTNDAGDFFYTTNESQAKQAGWTGSIIGYVRAL